MTFRTPGGTALHDPAAITPDDVVTIAPIGETSVAVAMSMGFLTRNAAGHIVPVGQGGTPPASGEQQSQPQPQLEQQQSEEPMSSLDPESEALMSRALTEAQGETCGAAVAAIDGNGVVPEAVVGQLAARLGIEPAEAAAKIEQVKAAYSTEAVSFTAKTMGTSADVVKEAMTALQHADATKSAFRRAAESHFSTGRPDGYTALVREWIANLDQTNPSRILGSTPVAGRAVRYDHNSKQILVKLPSGGEVPWSVAVRNGWISIK